MVASLEALHRHITYSTSQGCGSKQIQALDTWSQKFIHLQPFAVALVKRTRPWNVGSIHRWQVSGSPSGGWEASCAFGKEGRERGTALTSDLAVGLMRCACKKI